MDEFLSSQNSLKIFVACNRMLNEKFNVSLSNDKLEELITKVTNHVSKEYANSHTNISELNTITLSKIKGIYEKFREKDIISKQSPTVKKEYSVENEISDEKMINLKLKELEKKRSIIPVYEETIETSQQNDDNIITTNTPSVSFTLQPSISQKSLYQTYVINSAKRDWIKYPVINGFKESFTINTKDFMIFPHIVILPHYISSITPYIKLEISNEIQSLFYIFSIDQTNNNWDKWKTMENIENISLDRGNWQFKLYDLHDQIIDMGEDRIPIDEVSEHNDNFKIKLNSNKFKTGCTLCIYLNSNRFIYEKIIKVQDETLEILEISNSNKLKTDDLINAVVLNTSMQYSIIMNYIPNI